MSLVVSALRRYVDGMYVLVMDGCLMSESRWCSNERDGGGEGGR
jgi:hypothetical protein